jgi:hypothetical protein
LCARSDELARLGGVLGRGQVGVRTRAAPGGQLEHLWSQRGDDTAVLGHAVLVELVEVVGERVEGLLVFGVRLGVAHADAEQEPVGERLVDAVEGLRDGSRRGGPDVDDAGGHLQRGGGLENGFDPVEFSGWRTADPDGAIAQRFDFLGLLGGRAATEHAKLAEIGFRHGWVNPPHRRGYSVSIGLT